MSLNCFMPPEIQKNGLNQNMNSIRMQLDTSYSLDTSKIEKYH